MSSKLPRTLARYFTAASSHDVEAMIANFSEDAVVKDEGATHRGLAAIRQWMIDTIRKYDYKVEPKGFSERDGKSVVTGVVSGNFPGSPVAIRHEFSLERGKIARLEIG